MYERIKLHWRQRHGNTSRSPNMAAEGHRAHENMGHPTGSGRYGWREFFGSTRPTLLGSAGCGASCEGRSKDGIDCHTEPFLGKAPRPAAAKARRAEGTRFVRNRPHGLD